MEIDRTLKKIVLVPPLRRRKFARTELIMVWSLFERITQHHPLDVLRAFLVQEKVVPSSNFRTVLTQKRKNPPGVTPS